MGTLSLTYEIGGGIAEHINLISSRLQRIRLAALRCSQGWLSPVLHRRPPPVVTSDQLAAPRPRHQFTPGDRTLLSSPWWTEESLPDSTSHFYSQFSLLTGGKTFPTEGVGSSQWETLSSLGLSSLTTPLQLVSNSFDTALCPSHWISFRYIRVGKTDALNLIIACAL